MDLYNFLESICVERGININIMCKEAHVARASLGDLKSGRIKSLSSVTMKKLSNYLKLSVDEILNCKINENVESQIEEDIKKSSTSNEVLDDVTAEILERLSRMSSAEKNRALGYLDSLLASQENDGGFLK